VAALNVSRDSACDSSRYPLKCSAAPRESRRVAGSSLGPQCGMVPHPRSREGAPAEAASFRPRLLAAFGVCSQPVNPTAAIQKSTAFRFAAMRRCGHPSRNPEHYAENLLQCSALTATNRTAHRSGRTATHSTMFTSGT
jgi:hypothetical protein